MPSARPIAQTRDSAANPVTVLQYSGETAFFFKATLAIDADGAPNAYHPDDYPIDRGIGLDNPAHAGRPGNWWALATDADGAPFVQTAGATKGYWVSMTALSSGPEDQPSSYVDATRIPYIVLPDRLGNARPGDFCIVAHRGSRKYCCAIFADTNPAVGEASIACAQALGIDADARHGGISEPDVAYLVFPGSGNRCPRTLAEIQSEARALFETWGDVDRLLSSV